VKKKRTQSQPVEFGEDPLTSSLQTKSNQKEQFKQNYPSPSMLSSSLVTSREKVITHFHFSSFLGNFNINY